MGEGGWGVACWVDWGKMDVRIAHGIDCDRMIQIDTHVRGGGGVAVLVVQVPSKLVDETAEPLRETVQRRLSTLERPAVVLDCAGVVLVNSIGITCLLQLQELCRGCGAALILAAVPASISTFLAQLKLDRRFAQSPSVEAAVEAADPGE